MNDNVENYIPISAIQHYTYCQRRCYLVQVERLWMDNIFTAEGNIGHTNVDQMRKERRPSVYRAYRLQLTSRKLGLTGYADLVEFIPDDCGITVPVIDSNMKFIVAPVEYKRGKAKNIKAYQLQLCAQALCLEEMLCCSITVGFLYEEKYHHRMDVHLTEDLRNEVVLKIDNIRSLVNSLKPPIAHFEPKCRSCSLIDLCMPKVVEKIGGGQKYWSKFYSQEEM